MDIPVSSAPGLDEQALEAPVRLPGARGTLPQAGEGQAGVSQPRGEPAVPVRRKRRWRLLGGVAVGALLVGVGSVILLPQPAVRHSLSSGVLHLLQSWKAPVFAGAASEVGAGDVAARPGRAPAAVRQFGAEPSARLQADADRTEFAALKTTGVVSEVGASPPPPAAKRAGAAPGGEGTAGDSRPASPDQPAAAPSPGTGPGLSAAPTGTSPLPSNAPAVPAPGTPVNLAPAEAGVAAAPAVLPVAAGPAPVAAETPRLPGARASNPIRPEAALAAALPSSATPAQAAASQQAPAPTGATPTPSSTAPTASGSTTASTPSPATTVPAPPAPAASPQPAPKPSDAVQTAAEIRAAPLASPQQVQVVGLVRELGAQLKDTRLQVAQASAAVMVMQQKLGEFESRLSLAEAGTVLAQSARAGVPQTPVSSPQTQTQTAAVGSGIAGAAIQVGAGARTVKDYRIQGASPWSVVLSVLLPAQGEEPVLYRGVGDQVPGLGRIKSIFQRGTSWVVDTDRGLIQ